MGYKCMLYKKSLREVRKRELCSKPCFRSSKYCKYLEFDWKVSEVKSRLSKFAIVWGANNGKKDLFV